MLVMDGAVRIENYSGTWPVPTGCGAWIPARTRHAVAPTPGARVRTLYIYPARPRPCGVIAISPLLDAIADHVHHHGADRNLAAVLIDQLAAARELPLFLPALSSAISQRVAEVLDADPAGTPRIRDLAAELRVSARTLERAFLADAGIAFGEWRQRARIGRAIALLAGGMDVKDAALEVGYETPSAFVTAFKRYVGTTPGNTKGTKDTK